MVKPPPFITVRPSGIVASLPGAGNPLLQLSERAQSLLMAPVKMVWEKVDVAKRQQTPKERKASRFFMVLIKYFYEDKDSALLCYQHTTTSPTGGHRISFCLSARIGGDVDSTLADIHVSYPWGS